MTQGMIKEQFTRVPSLCMSMMPTLLSEERCFEVADLLSESCSASSQTHQERSYNALTMASLVGLPKIRNSLAAKSSSELSLSIIISMLQSLETLSRKYIDNGMRVSNNGNKEKLI